MRNLAARSWRTDPWALLGVAAGLSGLLVLATDLPTSARLPALLGFVAVGPGAVLQSHLRLAGGVRWLTIPVFGLSVVVLLTTAMAYCSLWQPQASLVVLATAIVVWSLWRVRTAVIADA